MTHACVNTITSHNQKLKIGNNLAYMYIYIYSTEKPTYTRKWGQNLPIAAGGVGPRGIPSSEIAHIINYSHTGSVCAYNVYVLFNSHFL